ncbi:hypothetical protein [Streptomyces sp. NPDC055400]
MSTPAQPVGDVGGLAGQVVVEADDHFQSGDGLAGGSTSRGACGMVLAAWASEMT